MKKLHLIYFLLINSLIYAQEIDYTKVPQIQTKATYTTEVQPDKITLSITLSESNSKGKISVEELEQKLENVLKSSNVDISKQLTLKDLSSNFQSYFLKKTDIQKTKNYNLEVFDANTAGKILRKLADNDISNVKLIKTEYSKIEELKIELKGKAVTKAKKQANEMVKALNQKVGSVIFISDMETNIANYLSGQVAGLNIRGVNSVGHYGNKESELNISFDNIRVDATVTVHFKIEQ
ncbi:MAG: SIMPL domain-containing protein [Flavobacteriales bacterium]